MLWILPCLSRRKTFLLCPNHLPSHKTGVKQGRGRLKIHFRVWTFCSRELKKESLKAKSHCGVSAALKGSPHHPPPPPPPRFPASSKGSKRAGTPQPAPQPPSPAALQVSGEKERWGLGHSCSSPRGRTTCRRAGGWHRAALCQWNTLTFYF